MNQAKKVLFVLGTSWASSYYRMGQAANLLRKSGFTLAVVMFDGVDPLNLTVEEPQLTGKAKIIDLKKFDTVIFQLVWHDALIHVIEMLKSRGIKTVMEVDDDYFALPFDNPSWISFHPKIVLQKNSKGELWGTRYKFEVNTKIATFKTALHSVDLIQVSTPELAKVYRPYGDIVILENCVENELYDKVPKRKNKKPVIGWFGTRTHKADLEITRGCYPSQDKFKMLLAGWPEVADMLFKNFTNLEVIQPYRIEELPSIVKKCDFGIAPLVDNRFNAGKSDLKGIEFGAAGLPVIASDVPPYRRWIDHNRNGFLVKKNKTKFWIRYMDQLLNDEKLRLKMGKEAKKDALKRDIKANIDKWVKAHFV